MINSWFLFFSLLFVFQNQEIDLADSELLDHIRVEYNEQIINRLRWTETYPVTTAKCLSDFLGPAMVWDKGLRCTYIIVQQQVKHDFWLFLLMLERNIVCKNNVLILRVHWLELDSYLEFWWQSIHGRTINYKSLLNKILCFLLLLDAMRALK
jgi:hypothetical protein